MSNLIAISGKQGSGKDTVAQMIMYLYYIEKVPNNKERVSYKDFLKHPNQSWNGLEIKKFADKVKDIACLLIGCTREQLEDREFKEKPLGEEWHIWFTQNKREGKKLFVSEEDRNYHLDWLKDVNFGLYEDTSIGDYRTTPRLLMQLIGTEASREILHPNIWINALFADYRCGGWDNGYKWMDCACEKGECDYSNSYTPKWIITDTRFPNEAKAVKDHGGILIRINRTSIYSVTSDFFHGVMGVEKHPSETALDNYKDWDYVIDNDGSLEDLFEKVKEIYESIN